MARQADADGIAAICATPHIRHDHDVRIGELAGRVARAQRRARASRRSPCASLTGGEVAETIVDAARRRRAARGVARRRRALDPARAARPARCRDSLATASRDLRRARASARWSPTPSATSAPDLAERLAAARRRGRAGAGHRRARSSAGARRRRCSSWRRAGWSTWSASDAHSSRGGRPVRLSRRARAPARGRARRRRTSLDRASGAARRSSAGASRRAALAAASSGAARRARRAPRPPRAARAQAVAQEVRRARRRAERAARRSHVEPGGQRRGERAHHRVAAALARAALEARRHELPARSSPRSTSAGSPPRVTITRAGAGVEQALGGRAPARGPSTGPRDVLGQLPVVELDEVGARPRARVSRRGEERSTRTGVPFARDVGDELAVDLERERVGRVGVADDEHVARRARPRRSPRRGRRARGAWALARARCATSRRSPLAAVDDVAAASRGASRPAAARRAALQQRREHVAGLAADEAAQDGLGAQLAAIRATHTPWPPACRWTSSPPPRRSTVMVSSGWGPKTATLPTARFALRATGTRTRCASSTRRVE